MSARPSELAVSQSSSRCYQGILGSDGDIRVRIANVMISIFLTLSKSSAAVKAVLPFSTSVSVPVPPSTLSFLVRPETAAKVKVSLPLPPVISSLPVPPVILRVPFVSALPLNVSAPEPTPVSVNVAPAATNVSLVVIVTVPVVLPLRVMASIFLALSKSLDAVKSALPLNVTVSVPAPPSIVWAVLKPVPAAIKVKHQCPRRR